MSLMISKPVMGQRNPAVSLALLTASVAINLTACAAAATTTEPSHKTVVVSYSDLDLTRPEAARTLYRRIKFAAHQACGYVDMRELKRAELAEECYERALNDAVMQVHSAALTAVHQTASNS